MHLSQSFRNLVRFNLVFFIFLSVSSLFAQDTLKILQYNLLGYPSSLNATAKNTYLKPIIQYIQPDIFGVNELDANPIYADNILTNVMNQTSVTSYKRAAFTNTASSNIVNMLYYDSVRVGLRGQDVVTNSLRDINVYHLYYNAPDLAITNDTIRFSIAVQHLKAGTGSSDASDRNTMVTGLMNYFDSNFPLGGNLLSMGDFNMYSSSEAGYQTYTTWSNNAVKFYDPINTPGSWGNNSAFASVHTQCTRLNSIGDGGSTGGLDDRFDFILCNSSVMNGNDRVKMISSAYNAIGQDGQHFNVSVNDLPANNSVPSNVLNSLYYMSDHLPIYTELEIDYTVGRAENLGKNNFSVRIAGNPAEEEIVALFEGLESGKNVHCTLTDATGKTILTEDHTAVQSNMQWTVHSETLPSGVYFLLVTHSGTQRELKIVK